MAVNPKDFLLNTDYEMDKIVLFYEGELSPSSAGSGYEQTISHGLGFTPLVFGVCAFNSDFSDARSLPYMELTQDNAITVSVEATQSTIKVSYGNYESTPAKAYYRIYAFEPDGSAADVPPTADNASEFVLNTDYNYCKLFKTGVVDGNSDTTISHGLGYLPFTLAWQESSNGLVEPIELNNWSDPITNLPYGVRVGSQDVLFKYSGQGLSKIHYRIYYDEA